jgi:hypothetical protein
MDNMKMLVPTTTNVGTSITVENAMAMLRSHSVSFTVEGTVEGMYMSSSQGIIPETMIIVSGTNVTAQRLCQIFSQECIMQYTSDRAEFVDSHGVIVGSATHKHEFQAVSTAEAVKLQKQLTKQYGGASRIGTHVWSWVVAWG